MGKNGGKLLFEPNPYIQYLISTLHLYVCIYLAYELHISKITADRKLPECCLKIPLVLRVRVTHTSYSYLLFSAWLLLVTNM